MNNLIFCLAFLFLLAGTGKAYGESYDMFEELKKSSKNSKKKNSTKKGSGGIGDILYNDSEKKSEEAPCDNNCLGGKTRSKEEIMQVVNANMPSLKVLYNKYLKQKPGFSGKVVLKFTIAPSGKIIKIDIKSSTTGYKEFDKAIKDSVATWKWKAVKDGNTTPTIPFNFTEEESWDI